MDYGKYQDVLDYAQSCINDDDFAHTCRVLNYALQILESKKGADASVVILAIILHDIGRSEGESDEQIRAGSERCYSYLVEKGYSEELARHVADCIMTRRQNSDAVPQTLEAKIVFDADKLDTTGAIGTARAIIQCQVEGMPMYTLGDDGLPLEGSKEEPASLMKSYRRSLRKLEKVFYTKAAKKIAARHQPVMGDYFEKLIEELNRNYKKGNELIKKHSR